MDTATDALLRAELADLGLTWVGKLSWNAPAPVLYQDAVARGEGLVAEGGGEEGSRDELELVPSDQRGHFLRAVLQEVRVR